MGSSARTDTQDDFALAHHEPAKSAPECPEPATGHRACGISTLQEHPLRSGWRRLYRTGHVWTTPHALNGLFDSSGPIPLLRAGCAAWQRH